MSPDATIEDKLGTKMRKTYAKKRKYGSQNSLFSIYISHFLSENYRLRLCNYLIIRWLAICRCKSAEIYSVIPYHLSLLPQYRSSGKYNPEYLVI